METPPEAAAARWPRASFVLLLPYKRTWVMRAMLPSSRREPWDAGLLRSGMAASTPESHWSKPGTYFFSQKVSRAAVAPAYGAWSIEPMTVWEELPELRPLIIERHEFFTAERGSRDRVAYLALHFTMAEADGPRLEKASQLLRRPGAHGEAVIARLCHSVGVALSYAQGGFAQFRQASLEHWGDRIPSHGPRAGLSRTREPRPQPEELGRGGVRLHANNSRSHVISFVGLKEEFSEPPSTLRDVQNWRPRQAWLYQLASGMNRRRYFALPSPTAEAASDGVFLRGAATCRAEQDGLAIVADPVLAKPEHLHDLDSLELLAHGRIVDLVMLSLRQRAWLDRHTEELARPLHASGAVDAVSAMVDRENELVWFRNSRWFTEVPGRPEATQVLRQLQRRLETPQLLEDAREEEQDLLRVASLVRQQTQLQVSKRQERSRELTEIAVAALAPPSVVLSLAALFGGPSLAFGLISLLLAAAVGALAVLAVWLSRRDRRSSEPAARANPADSADW